jgi:hypothetical protein
MRQENQSLDAAVFVDLTSKNQKQWNALTKRVVDTQAREISKTYGVSFSHRLKAYQKFNYRIPNVERLVIHALNRRSGWTQLTQQQMQLFLAHLENYDHEINEDISLYINGHPAQSRAAYLRKSAIFSLNIIANMALAVKAPGTERGLYHNDFRVLKALNQPYLSNEAKLRSLCWIALVDEKLKASSKNMWYNPQAVIQAKLTPLYSEDEVFQIKACVVRHTHHLSSQLTDTQANLLLDLLLQKLNQPLVKAEFLRYKKLYRGRMQNWISELLVSRLDVACFLDPTLRDVDHRLRDLWQYMLQGSRDIGSMSALFREFEGVIKRNIFQMINVMIDEKCRVVTTQQAQNAIAKARENIHAATVHFQSQVPPQVSRVVSRVMTAVVSVVTLGLGALAIALYNKWNYGSYQLERRHSYTATQAAGLGLFAQSCHKRSYSAPSFPFIKDMGEGALKQVAVTV